MAPNDVDSDHDGLVDGAGDMIAVADYPDGIDSNGDSYVYGELDFGTNPSFSNLGDLAPRGNLDNLVNASDLVVLTQIVLDIIQPAPLESVLGDMNSNGQINTGDLLLMQQMVLTD